MKILEKSAPQGPVNRHTLAHLGDEFDGDHLQLVVAHSLELRFQEAGSNRLPSKSPVKAMGPHRYREASPPKNAALRKIVERSNLSATEDDAVRPSTWAD